MTIAIRHIGSGFPAPAQFAPPPDPIRFYTGRVMHARLKPFGHRFNYSVFTILLDIGRLPEADAVSPFFSINRHNLTSFHETDHIDPASGAQTLSAYIQRLLAQAGFPERPDRVLLLTYPRVFGYVFNPISVYFAYKASGDLLALVYEVRNTFGGHHTYVCGVGQGETSPAGVRQTRPKRLHVSPFIGMGATYHFRVQPPGDTVKIRILETEGGEPVLSATFSGDAERFSTRSLLANIARMPLMTLKVTGGIHWEALKLWLKGARFHRSPVGMEDTKGGETAYPIENKSQ